jgi:molybdate transport system ATP-binding protein
MSLQRTPTAPRFIQVDLKQVGLTLGERPVLRRIDWQIESGQRWVLMGANGAGKTQLMKLIAGDVWPSPARGSARLYRYRSEVHGEPYAIKDEIAYLGAERQDRYEHYQWNHKVEAIAGTGIHRTDIPLDPLDDADRARIATILRRLGIAHLDQRRFLTLSYGERRLVLLARALLWRPKLLLLDELFNGLDRTNYERAQQCLAALSRSALPWVLSTHREEDIPPGATHLCRLQHGRVVYSGVLDQPARRRRQTLPSAVPARERSRPRPADEAKAKAKAEAEPLLQLRRASVWREGRRVLHDLTLTVRRGDCWVVHGSNGSGKSSLLQLLYGDLGVAHGGLMWRAGIESGVPIEVFKRHVGLVAPELQAAHPRHLSVEEVVSSGQYSSIGMDPIRTLAMPQLIRQALRRSGGASLQNRRLRSLSYGQLRRVLFARALIHEPDILLLDEPYAGIDVRTRASLMLLVERQLAAGTTVVMATHHRDEWPRAVSHELELERSRPVYCGRVR